MRTLPVALRLIVLGMFPLGWASSASIFAQEGEYYFVLNLLAFLAAAGVLGGLRGEFRLHLHLWVIFLVYLIGYFFKYYLLCFMFTEPQEFGAFLDTAYPREVGFFTNEEFLLRYFELVTTVLVCLAVLVHLLPMSPIRRNPTAPEGHFEIQRTQLMRRLPKYLWAVVLLSVMVFAINWSFGIGTPSGEDRTEPPLPFRLAGMVAAVHNGVLPLTFIVIIWLTDRYGQIKVNRLAVAAYIAFGLAGGIITTSKAALITVMASLMILWLVTGRLTRGRLLALFVMLPLAALFSILLGVHRSIRSLNSDLGIIDVVLMGFNQLFASSTATDGFGLSKLFGFFGVFLRINGADSLLNILSYAPNFSWERSLDLLFASQSTVADLYATEVLGWFSLVGTAFSPSLLGYFYFVFPSAIGVCVGFVAYVLFWHWLFTQVRKLDLVVEPVILVLMAIMLAFFTSEGTLESMPQRIAAVFVLTLLGERFIRRFKKNKKYHITT
jgi:hypothetical protein